MAKREGSSSVEGAASSASQLEIARIQRVREIGLTLQRTALELAEMGEAGIGAPVLAAAMKASKAKARAVS